MAHKPEKIVHVLDDLPLALWPEHVLDLYVLGRLTPEEDATVTTHVEACEECREQIAETIKLIQELRLACN